MYRYTLLALVLFSVDARCGLPMPAPAPSPLPYIYVESGSTMLESMVAGGEIQTITTRTAGSVIEKVVVESLSAANEAVYSATLRQGTVVSLTNITAQTSALEFSGATTARVATLSGSSLASVAGLGLSAYALGLTVGLLYETNGNVYEVADSLRLYFVGTPPIDVPNATVSPSNLYAPLLNPVIVSNSTGVDISGIYVDFSNLNSPDEAYTNELVSQLYAVFFDGAGGDIKPFLATPFVPNAAGICPVGMFSYSGIYAKNGAICLSAYLKDYLQPVFRYDTNQGEYGYPDYDYSYGYSSYNAHYQNYNSTTKQYYWTNDPTYTDIIGYDFPTWFISGSYHYYSGQATSQGQGLYYYETTKTRDKGIQLHADGLYYLHPSCFWSPTKDLAGLRITSECQAAFSGKISEYSLLSQHVGVPQITYLTSSTGNVKRDFRIDTVKDQEEITGFVLSQDVKFPLLQPTPEGDTHLVVRDQVEYALNPLQPTALNPYPYPYFRPNPLPDIIPFPLPRYISPHRIRRLTTLPKDICGTATQPCSVTGELAPLPDSYGYEFHYDPTFPFAVPKVPIVSTCASIPLDFSSLHLIDNVSFPVIHFSLHCDLLNPYQSVARPVFKLIWLLLCVVIVLSA
ncbi:hypothetical protein [Beggiatoa leptomitoformis]|uniref:Uncharacterized protein n=1 Tax=Beggiatoa leptomitoformis TaxID=288004 RepID=A0A2N9YCW3_9GAMM|nr:hypothetical protein [Beggiatoa leptomitoformis]ALG66428.1 hypothetical protein AL038_00075 [Beggiatoa leptomitoformis]AUI68295.1 hypothetical protein BLE401_05995 [Beggiatoa leptomitoformis]